MQRALFRPSPSSLPLRTFSWNRPCRCVDLQSFIYRLETFCVYPLYFLVYSRSCTLGYLQHLLPTYTSSFFFILFFQFSKNSSSLYYITPWCFYFCCFLVVRWSLPTRSLVVHFFSPIFFYICFLFFFFLFLFFYSVFLVLLLVVVVVVFLIHSRNVPAGCFLILLVIYKYYILLFSFLFRAFFSLSLYTS